MSRTCWRASPAETDLTFVFVTHDLVRRAASATAACCWSTGGSSKKVRCPPCSTTPTPRSRAASSKAAFGSPEDEPHYRRTKAPRARPHGRAIRRRRRGAIPQAETSDAHRRSVHLLERGRRARPPGDRPAAFLAQRLGVERDLVVACRPLVRPAHGDRLRDRPHLRARSTSPTCCSWSWPWWSSRRSRRPGRLRDLPRSWLVMLLAIGGAAARDARADARPRHHPEHGARYVIPIAGMVIGNTMNVASVTGVRLLEDTQAQRPRIEAALALGAARARRRTASSAVGAARDGAGHRQHEDDGHRLPPRGDDRHDPRRRRPARGRAPAGRRHVHAAGGVSPSRRRPSRCSSLESSSRRSSSCGAWKSGASGGGAGPQLPVQVKKKAGRRFRAAPPLRPSQ